MELQIKHSRSAPKIDLLVSISLIEFGMSIIAALYHGKNYRNGQGINLFEVKGIAERNIHHAPGDTVQQPG